MATPKRNTVEAFYDVFADMKPEEQAIAIKVLEQTHRLAKRSEKKKAAAPDWQTADTTHNTHFSLKEPA